MSKPRQYRIGEFARLGGTSIKTLRFYDELGLLRPASIDARTRYRFYEAAQLRELAAIHALQELGASLQDIRRTLRCPDDRERRKLLATLRASALRNLSSTQRSLAWLELELEQSDQGMDFTPIVLKQRGEIRIASVRARLAAYADIAPMERDLACAVHPSHAGEQRGVLWHRCEASGAIEGEPFMELRASAPRTAGYELKQLPRAQVASAYCELDDEAAVRTYECIDRWIHRQSLRLDGPKREIYVGPLLEIQFPVRPD
jgi:DNA-binding transcriptional MerR regulator